jgi:hypothetical protein
MQKGEVVKNKLKKKREKKSLANPGKPTKPLYSKWK